MAILDAGQLFDKVSQQFHRGEYADAERGLHQLLAQVPDQPVVLFMLGCCMQTSIPPRHGVALILFQECARLEENKAAWEFVDPRAKPQIMHHVWNNMGVIHRAELRKQAAELCFKKALGYTERKASIYANMSSLHINDGTPYQCITWADRAVEAADSDKTPDSDSARAKETAIWNKGHALLELGKWEEGWKCFNTDLRSKSKMHRNYHHDKETPWWDGSPGKTVVLFGEQGIGDEVMFSSCVQEVIKISKQVIIHPTPRLEGLLQRSFPGAIVYGGHEKGQVKQDLPWWINQHEIDACLPLGHLPTMYRNSDAAFPKHQGYLKPDPLRVADYKDRLAKLGNRPKIGISWQGGAKETRIDYRSVRPEMLREFVKRIPADFISLQYSAGAAEEAQEIGIAHWADAAEADNMDEVAALIASCDLVISVCTTAIHIAGAMNIPAFVMVPDKPAWRYQIKGSGMAWYPSVRLFRQEKDEGWQNVITKVEKETCSFLNRIAKQTPNSTLGIPGMETRGLTIPNELRI